MADALSRGIAVPLNEPTSFCAEDELIVCKLSTEVESEWLVELREDELYSPIIKNLEANKLGEEVRLPRVDCRLMVADFTIDNGYLKILRPDGSMAKVVPKSLRKKAFEEAHAGSMAGHFAPKKVVRVLSREVF